MKYKSTLHTIGKGTTFILQYIPRILQDSFALISHFYRNSPTIKSRTLGVFLKAGFETLILNNNLLSKDGNPVSSSVVREGVNIVPITYNVITSTQHVSSRPEVLEGFYLIGQLSRFTCKVTPQLLFGTNVIVSRLSNIICDPFAIMGNDLSKMSQVNSSKQIYWFWNTTNNTSVENIWAGKFLQDKLTVNFVRKATITAGVKSVILDQIGEVIKLFKQSPFIEISYNYIDGLEKQIINQISNFNLANKAAPFLQKTFTYLNKALPDLFIEGPMMLSISNDISRLYREASQKEEAVIVITATLAAIFKKELFSLTTQIAPQLIPIGVTLLFSDDDYNKFKNTISNDIAFISEKTSYLCSVTSNFFIGEEKPYHDEQ